METTSAFDMNRFLLRHGRSPDVALASPGLRSFPANMGGRRRDGSRYCLRPAPDYSRSVKRRCGGSRSVTMLELGIPESWLHRETSSTMMKRETFAIANIYVPAKRRAMLDPRKAQEIAESILENGLQVPILVRKDGERYVLVEGLHRLEACKQLGEQNIFGYLVQARRH